uniref:Uncharacterized protein n=2 Tax=Cacopsylla melanoneura TaxID=428564 RepID=A0A8D9A7S9_9HEMI
MTLMTAQFFKPIQTFFGRSDPTLQTGSGSSLGVSPTNTGSVQLSRDQSNSNLRNPEDTLVGESLSRDPFFFKLEGDSRLSSSWMKKSRYDSTRQVVCSCNSGNDLPSPPYSLGIIRDGNSLLRTSQEVLTWNCKYCNMFLNPLTFSFGRCPKLVPAISYTIRSPGHEPLDWNITSEYMVYSLSASLNE